MAQLKQRDAWSPEQLLDAPVDARVERAGGGDARSRAESGPATWLIFAPIVAALTFAVFGGAALAWDGAAYLFQIVDRGRALTPNNRLINLPLQVPVLLASRATDNLGLMRAAFSLGYVAVPLLALACSWWVVRKRAPSLFVWAVLGIGLGTLPGQFDFASEAKIAVQLTWPVVLAILVGLERTRVPLVAVLAIAIFFSHPTAIPIFAIIALLALVVGARRPETRRTSWATAAAFGLGSALAMVWFWLFQSSYEASQLSATVLRNSFGEAVAGLPLLALGCAWLGAALIAAPLLIDRLREPGLRRIVQVASAVSIAAAGGLLLVWASDPERWASAISYKSWVLICSLPFMLIATLDALAGGTAATGGGRRDWHRRTRLGQLVAIIFALVLIVQSTAWMGLNRQLSATIDRSPWACISALPTGVVGGTPLDHWSIATRSVLVQGQDPEKVVLSGDGCGVATLADNAYLYRYLDGDFLRARKAEGSGWFDLGPLNKQLATERDNARGCTFSLAAGWHSTEMSGPYWWRWSDGRAAQIRVVLDQPATVVLRGEIESATTGNRVAIEVNGQNRGTVQLPATGLRPLGPLSLPLQAGANVIQLTSQNAPIPAAADGRPLGLSVANLLMAVDESNQPCAFHP